MITPRERRYYTAYKCIAQNRLGAAEHFVELRQVRIPDIIPQAKAVNVTATSVTFDILSPPYDPGMPITEFIVQYKKRDEPDWANANKRAWPIDGNFTVDDLKPQTFYNFRFAAVNEVGVSEFGAYVVQATAHDANVTMARESFLAYHFIKPSNRFLILLFPFFIHGSRISSENH